MTSNKKRMWLIIALLAILIIAAAVYSINSKDSKGNDNNVPESATTEEVTSETKENAEKDTGEFTGEDKNAVEKETEEDKGKEGKDSGKDKDDKAAEATILENHGDVEIIIPDEMGDDGF